MPREPWEPKSKSRSTIQLAVMVFEIWALPVFSSQVDAQSIPPITVTPNLSGQTVSGIISYPSISAPCEKNPDAFPAVIWDGAPVENTNGKLNTTRFLNGQHTLYVDEVNGPTPSNPCNVPYGPITFTTSNGHSAMQLRANYNELWLTPGQSVQLTPKMLYTDNVALPLRAESTTFSSASSEVVTVDGNGNVFAAGLGDTNITLTSGSLSDDVIVHVNAVNETPQFGNDGSELTSYVPGKSMFVRSMFFSLDNSVSQYADALHAAQVNTLEGGFYAPPGPRVGTSTSAMDAWNGIYSSNSNYTNVANAQDAVSVGFNLILTGDDIARGGAAVYDATEGPSTHWPTDPITYAMTWAKNLGKVIGVEMVDEITSQYAVPFPQGQLGATGGPESIVCVNNTCTVNWPSPYVIGNGANVVYITGATSDPNLNSPNTKGYQETGRVSGPAYWNGFTFTVSGVGTHTFTPATDPNLNIGVFATDGDNHWIPNNAISQIMSYINAVPGGPPNITWPAAAAAPAPNFGAWADSPASTYNDIYFTYLSQSYPANTSLYDGLAAFNTYWNTKYPYAQKNKPTLFLVSDSGPFYRIQATPLSISSFDGTTMTFSQPHGITNLQVGLTRLSVTGDSNPALSGNYYVYKVVDPITVEVYPEHSAGPTVSGPNITVTFNDGQEVTLAGNTAASLYPTGIGMKGASYCPNADNFGHAATVVRTTYAPYNGQWYVFPAADQNLPAGSTCIWSIKMVPLSRGQSASGGTASLITNDYYQPGDPITIGGTTPSNVATNVMYAAEKGASGVRVYLFGNDENTSARINALFTPSDGTVEQEANPLYNGSNAQALWQGLSNSFNLVHDLEPYLLQPKLNSPDYGPRMVTGARTSSYGTLLMMTNYSEEPNLVVPIDLSEYNPSGGPGTMYEMTASSVTQQSISGTYAQVNFAPGETVAFIFPEAKRSRPPTLQRHRSMERNRSR